MSFYDVCANNTLIRGVDDPWVSFTPGVRTFNWVLFGFTWGLTIAFTGVFLYYKKRFDRLRVRSSTLVIFSAIGCVLDGTVGCMTISIPEQFPCALQIWMVGMIIPFTGSAILLRLLQFHYFSKFSMAALNAHKAQAKLMQSTSAGTGEEEQQALHGTRTSQFAETKQMLGMFLNVSSQRLNVFSSSGRLAVGGSGKGGNLGVVNEDEERAKAEETKKKSEQDQQLNLKMLKFIISWRGNLLIFSALMLPFFITCLAYMLSEPVFLAGCTNCDMPWAFFIILLLFAFFIIGTTVFVFYQSREFPDRWGYRRENSLATFGGFVAVVGLLLSLLGSTFEVFHYQFLLCLGFLMNVFAQTVLQVYLAWRNDVAASVRRGSKKSSVTQDSIGVVATVADDWKSQGSKTNNNNNNGLRTITLNQIMKDEELLRLFESHLTHEFGIESLIFINDAEAWAKAFFDTLEKVRNIRARKLYNLYLGPNAVYSINIPSYMTEELTERVENGRIDAEMFNPAVVELRKLLNIGAVRRFAKTKEFQEWAKKKSVPSGDIA